jgi:catechol 2,3-dioxygenase-like lactoylglutathione lyase family enzyme
MRLSSAMLFVKDLATMTRFYQGVLGLEPIAETRLDDYVEFGDRGARFALHAIPFEIAQGIEIPSPPPPRERSPVKLCFEVEDVERERTRLEASGVPFISRPWGACEAVDPEGNIFQLCAPRDPR